MGTGDEYFSVVPEGVVRHQPRWAWHRPLLGPSGQCVQDIHAQVVTWNIRTYNLKWHIHNDFTIVITITIADMAETYGWITPRKNYIVFCQRGKCSEQLPWLQHNVVGMGRIWNFTRIEYSRNFEHKSNTNIHWLLIRLEYRTVSRCLARTQRHPIALGASLSQSRRHRGHVYRHHRSFCLIFDLTMKTTSYSRQMYPHISYEHIHTLGSEIKSLTFLWRIKLTKPTCAKLDMI